jgi:hypothetical protein
MSSGLPEDAARTQEQRENPTPATGGRNWLRHAEDSEAARIDQLLLTGGYTIEEMAHQISLLSVRNAGDIPALISRVRKHLSHLQEEWNGQMEPHHLRLREDANGRWSFDV